MTGRSLLVFWLRLMLLILLRVSNVASLLLVLRFVLMTLVLATLVAPSQVPGQQYQHRHLPLHLPLSQSPPRVLLLAPSLLHHHYHCYRCCY